MNILLVTNREEKKTSSTESLTLAKVYISKHICQIFFQNILIKITTNKHLFPAIRT